MVRPQPPEIAPATARRKAGGPTRKIVHSPNRVVAYYISSRPASELVPAVEYFNEESLHEFLFERWKTTPPDDGILQRFVEPLPGEEFNSTIRVLWTPYICSMERATNLNAIHDHKLPAAKRAATFDAEAHDFSTTTIRGPKATSRLLRCTQHVLSQLRRLLVDSMTGLPTHEVAEAVLFLKLRPNDSWLKLASTLSEDGAPHLPPWTV